MKTKSALGFLVLSLLLILLLGFSVPAPSQIRTFFVNFPSNATTPTRSHPLQGSVAQQGGDHEILRLEANLVTVPAVVMDRDGRYITTLRKEDFQILEDGVEQEVSFFAPVEQPFTILFLLDTSGSMIFQMADLARAANALLGQLRPDDRLIVASFDEQVDILLEATKVSELRKSIRFRQRVRSGPITMVYDAVDYGLKRFKKVLGRKAIVLFSDGVGSGIFASEKRNLRDAEEQDALIYTVQFNTDPAEPPATVIRKNYLKQIEDANNYMRDLAQRTGGRHYQVESISELGKTFGLVAEELRRQYCIGYYPKKRLEEGQRRRIKVNVRLPNLVVRARDSYTIGPSKTIRQ